MKKANIIGALVIVTFSLAFTIEASKMPLFEGQSPGPGFVPLMVGILTLALSGALVFQSVMMNAGKANVPFMKNREGLRDILIITVSLFAYAGCIYLLGFSITTFLFLFTLLKVVGKYKYQFSLTVSAITTIVLYAIFQYWLDLVFPTGIFAFL